MVLTREYVDVPVGERAMRTFVAEPAAPGLVSRHRLLHRHLPAHRVQPALGGAARGLRVRGRRARDLPPRRAGRAPCSGSTTRARCAGRPTPRRSRPPSSTRTSRRRWTWLGGACPSSARRGTARAGIWRSGRRSTPRVRGTACWYPTGLHDGKLGKDRSDALARVGEIDGELLLIFGARDPHTPRRGARDRARRAGAAGARSPGTSTTPSTRSGATSARASTRRRPTPRSPRPSRSSGGRCDPLRPPGVRELPEGADPARAARARLRACDRRPVHGRDAGAPSTSRATRTGACPCWSSTAASCSRSRRRSCSTWPRARRTCRRTGLARARVHQWLFFEQNQIEPGLAVARFMALVGRVAKHPEVFGDRLRAGAARPGVDGARAGRRTSSPATGVHGRRHRALRLRALRRRGGRGAARVPAHRGRGWSASRPRRASSTTSSRSPGRMADRPRRPGECRVRGLNTAKSALARG